MTTQLTQQNISFDHEPLSASTQRSSLRALAGDDRIQSAPVLHPCVYIAFRCSRCGAGRQAMSQLPAQSLVACPECSQECAFVLLGTGLTSKTLPFHHVHIVEPMQWDTSFDDETNSS